VLSGSERRYTPTDRVLAEDLARRTATAIDNALLYREAQQALSARDEFLSVAAHELKTPITSVRGFVELATRQFSKAGGPDLQRLERAIRAIDRESLKLSYLVSRLFDIARIEAGQLALERATTDVSNLVREAATSAQLTTTQHSIRVDAPETAPALVDSLRLEQVLTNLLSNAIKYSPHGGPIDVEVSTPRANLLRIVVRDHGVGIPIERRTRLFERFYQTRAGDRIAGLGLGLYISRQIVEAHGGHIEVESPPDVGTRVIVDLPVDGVGHGEDGGA
jgi:signal transduction histidine kinase